MDINLKPTDADLKEYFLRSGDKELPDGEIEVNEHGFCIWRLQENAFILVAAFGDGEFWDIWVDEKARENNMKQVIFATKRNPEPFIRKYGCKITGYILAREVKP